MPFCAACIAREIKKDEVLVADAAASLARSATIRRVEFACTSCGISHTVLVAWDGPRDE
jgi:hypothetical protein